MPSLRARSVGMRIGGGPTSVDRRAPRSIDAAKSVLRAPSSGAELQTPCGSRVCGDNDSSFRNVRQRRVQQTQRAADEVPERCPKRRKATWPLPTSGGLTSDAQRRPKSRVARRLGGEARAVERPSRTPNAATRRRVRRRGLGAPPWGRAGQRQRAIEGEHVEPAPLERKQEGPRQRAELVGPSPSSSQDGRKQAARSL